MNEYNLIYESLCEAYNNGEITKEFAEEVNDLAYNKYVTEDGHSKNLKAKHNAKKKHNMQRMLDSMNYKHVMTDKEGNKHGTVKQSDGREVDLFIRNNKSKRTNMIFPNKTIHYDSRYDSIQIPRNVTGLKGIDLIASHEYSHALDNGKIKDKINE